jgi:hypothetical protein
MLRAADPWSPFQRLAPGYPSSCRHGEPDGTNLVVRRDANTVAHRRYGPPSRLSENSGHLTMEEHAEVSFKRTSSTTWSGRPRQLVAPASMTEHD